MEKSIVIQLHTKYHTLGELSEQTEQIWFALHGYGQLAEFFARKFDFLDKRKYYVIAPQGLNKFYLKEFSGRVGANWMTKEDRLNEIANYVNYLNSIYKKELEGIDLQKVKINVLAFSQGCSTASRWIANTDLRFDELLLWAGEIPQDVIGQPIFKTIPTTFVMGTQDELLSAAFVEAFLERLKLFQLHPKIIRFEGKHEIDKDVLKALIY
ncbi:MAG: phospholipase [Cytophagales bacterium]|nr:MAG: phospholipase [Cytophagales bacterium]